MPDRQPCIRPARGKRSDASGAKPQFSASHLMVNRGGRVLESPYSLNEGITVCNPPNTFTTVRALLTVRMEAGRLMDSNEFLLRQGEAIVNALKQRGYVINQFENKLQWQITQPDDNWWLLLTFLPRPVAQWRLLPASYDSNQTAIYSIIEQAIGGRR